MTKVHHLHGARSVIAGVHSSAMSGAKGGVQGAHLIENDVIRIEEEAVNSLNNGKEMIICMGKPGNRKTCPKRFLDGSTGFYCCGGVERGNC